MLASRKARAWAATPEEVPSLGRGAKRLAKKSTLRFRKPAVTRCLKQLRRLIETERASKLGQGDVLVEMIDRHQLRAIDIARQTNQRPADLSQMYNTCRMFPPRRRRKGVPYNIYFLSLRVVRKFKTLNLKPTDVLNEILPLRLTQHRDVTAHFSAKARRVENDRAVELSRLASATLPFNRAYHAQFQSLPNIFPDESIKVLHGTRRTSTPTAPAGVTPAPAPAAETATARPLPMQLPWSLICCATGSPS